MHSGGPEPGVHLRSGFGPVWQLVGRVVSGLVAAGRHLVRERRCLACGQPFLPITHEETTPRFHLFCPACTASMPRREIGYCPFCGELAAWPTLPLAPCGHCLNEPPPWQAFYFHGAFSGLLRQMVHRLKYANGLAEGVALGRLLAEHPGLGAEPFTLVVPVPLHPVRLRARGFNQAMEIGRGFVSAMQGKAGGHGTSVGLAPGMLCRVRNNRQQTGLSRKERRENTRGIFTAAPDVAGQNILLVDDVVTTGATLKEATRTLIQAGAARVAVAVVARTAVHGHRQACHEMLAGELRSP